MSSLLFLHLLARDEGRGRRRNRWLWIHLDDRMVGDDESKGILSGDFHGEETEKGYYDK